MTGWGAITWTIARAGGFVAFGLVTASVVLGILLDLKWRSREWPRFVTNEVHRFVTLVALVFTGIHTVAVMLDPFVGFTLGEVFVPLASHYRPIWVALGIVAAYLLLALWVSEWARPRIGYAWWRRFHFLAFAAYLLAVVHGLGAGSDARAPWAIGLYGGSLVAVAGLLGLRLFPQEPSRRRHPLVAAFGVLVLVELVIWAAFGPLQPGWNAIANEGHGSGQVQGP